MNEYNIEETSTTAKHIDLPDCVKTAYLILCIIKNVGSFAKRKKKNQSSKTKVKCVNVENKL